MIKKDAYSLFSRGLNSYMSRKGYTLDDVAKILDITAQSVHAIRSGKTLPRFDKVFTLIENGMTLYEIFGTELAEKLTAEMREVLPETQEQKDAFDNPELKKVIADTIAELVAKGYKTVNPLK
jgi:transcriptional regulator with XRE-family HTH domain